MRSSLAEALAASARVLDHELRNPSPNPLLPRPIPEAVIRAWGTYNRRLRVALATQRGAVGARLARRGLLAAFKRVEDAARGDRGLRAAIRFHGAVLRRTMPLEGGRP